MLNDPMTEQKTDTGLYRSIKCPHCERKIDLVIAVYRLPTFRKKTIGEIETHLSHAEFQRFKRLSSIEKIVFSIGKFHDVKGKWPSEKELSPFIGLKVQTISKYINKTGWISSTPQERGISGKFEEKKFCLNHEGKMKYSELTYKLFGYT